MHGNIYFFNNKRYSNLINSVLLEIFLKQKLLFINIATLHIINKCKLKLYFYIAMKIKKLKFNLKSMKL